MSLTTTEPQSQLSRRVTGEATEPDHLAHHYTREQFADIRTVPEDALKQIQDEGRLAREIDPTVVSAHF